MNFLGQVPLKNPSTHAQHFGAGSQHGKPYYHLGQECEKANVPRGNNRNPLDLSKTALARTKCNDRHSETTLHAFGDPLTHRSCRVSYNKDGMCMDSSSHYTKIGSKHLCAPRPDHPSALHRGHSMPEIHPWSRRRDQLRDPTPSYFNAAFSTTSDQVGKFYSAPLMTAPSASKFPKAQYDWYKTKESLR